MDEQLLKQINNELLKMNALPLVIHDDQDGLNQFLIYNAITAGSTTGYLVKRMYNQSSITTVMDSAFLPYSSSYDIYNFNTTLRANLRAAFSLPPISSNAIVQAWIDKITADGKTHVTQAKADIYTTAWNFADVAAITPTIEVFGLFKTPTSDLITVPFIHTSTATRFLTTGSVNHSSLSGINNVGFPGFNYIRTNFIPNNGTKYLLNDAYIVAGGTVGGNGTIIGTCNPDGAASVRVKIDISGNNLRVNMNSADVGTMSNSSLEPGQSIFGVKRTSNTNIVGIQGDRPQGNITQNSTAKSSSELTVLDNTTIGDPYNGSCSFFAVGGGGYDKDNWANFINLLLL